jgi:hypothetical protein
MRQLQRESGHWWFHLDLDVLSTAALATVRYRQRGGLSWDERATLIAAALRQPGLTLGHHHQQPGPGSRPLRRGQNRGVSRGYG